jgi:fructose-1,6-bisphosphatase I / sedoheptulose-1,7-bisphosphatase
MVLGHDLSRANRLQKCWQLGSRCFLGAGCSAPVRKLENLQSHETTLSQFLAQQLYGCEKGRGLAAVILDIASAYTAISVALGRGALSGALEAKSQPALALQAAKQGEFLVALDPLNGLPESRVNESLGSGFSVVPAPIDNAPEMRDFSLTVASGFAVGYALYGPATVLVLCVGKGTHGFTLDRDRGSFVLTHASIRIPEEPNDCAIIVGDERLCEAPVRRYLEECKAGETGIRGQQFKAFGSAGMVADIHRVLMCGGLALFPKAGDSLHAGGLSSRRMSASMAMLIEQAGGLASTGRERLLDAKANGVDQHRSLFMGSRKEVERLERYYFEHDRGLDEKYSSPLFKERSLFQ